MIIYSIFDRMVLCNAAPGSAHSPRGGRIEKDLHQSGCLNPLAINFSLTEALILQVSGRDLRYKSDNVKP